MRWILPMLLGLLLGVCATARASDGPDLDRNALILIRTLAYDRALAERAGGAVTIGVAYDPVVPVSKAAFDQVMKVFAGLGPTTTLQGLPLNATGLPIANLHNGIAGVDAVLIVPGMVAHIPLIVALTRKHQVVSMAMEGDAVDLGVSVGVSWVRGEPRIRVNLPASRLEGTQFGADLLKLADVVR